MKRIKDEPYFTHSVYSTFTTGIQVKCPKCYGMGIVTADEGSAYFKCTNCGYQAEKERTVYRYDVHNQCKNCGRYYRVDIEETAKQHFSALHVKCPYCGTMMSGKYIRRRKHFPMLLKSIRERNRGLVWDCGFLHLFKESQSGQLTGSILPI